MEEAIRVLGDIHSGNAHLAANLHANLGALYHKAGRMDLPKLYMEQGVQLLEEYNLTGYHDSVTQICNYAALITEGLFCITEAGEDGERTQFRSVSGLWFDPTGDGKCLRCKGRCGPSAALPPTSYGYL